MEKEMPISQSVPLPYTSAPIFTGIKEGAISLSRIVNRVFRRDAMYDLVVAGERCATIIHPKDAEFLQAAVRQGLREDYSESPRYLGAQGWKAPGTLQSACENAFCRDHMTAICDDLSVKGVIVHPDDADFIRGLARNAGTRSPALI